MVEIPFLISKVANDNADLSKSKMWFSENQFSLRGIFLRSNRLIPSGDDEVLVSSLLHSKRT